MFMALVLWATAGVVTAGTAGVIAGLPFTGEMELDFPWCCTGATPPTARAGEGVEEPVAIGGDATAFLVAEAYDCVDCDTLLVLEAAWLGICGC